MSKVSKWIRAFINSFILRHNNIRLWTQIYYELYMALGRVSVYYNDGKWTICLFLVILQTLILCNLLILLSVFLPRQSAECKLRLEKCFKTFYLFYVLYGCPKSNFEPMLITAFHLFLTWSSPERGTSPYYSKITNFVH